MPAVGEPGAPLLVVGLAPGLCGANRTGRPFTGDTAGDLLWPVLRRLGFGAEEGGGGALGCRTTNAVRCVPPRNRPTAAELAACRPFLAADLGLTTAEAPRPRAVLCLGGVAHGAVVRALGLPARDHPFAHGALARPAGGPVLAASYHPSRYNVNTGRMTAAMLAAVVGRLRTVLCG